MSLRFYLITVTGREALVEQELLPIPKHQGSSPVLVEFVLFDL